MIEPIYIGLMGASILIAAWLFETIEGIKEHKSLIDIRFAVAFLSAIILLTVYSWQIKDQIFFWLNTILLGIVVIEIAYTLFLRKTRKRFKR